MRKVDLKPSTEIAALCLYGGLLCVFMLSGPAIMRRGYPEIDPWMLALPWLWPVPILLAAPFRRTPRLKDWVMVGYCAGAAGVLFGAFGSVSVPRYMPPHAMLIAGIALSLPMRLLALPVEALGLLCLHAIGVRQADADLPPLDEAVPAEKVARVWVYLAVVAAAAVAFPFVHHHVAVENARREGAQAAERDWAAGEAWRPVMMDEHEWHPGANHTYDPRTGLQIYLVGRGLVYETWWEAYRGAIEQELAEHGPAPMVKNLFTEEQLHDLVEGPSIRRVTEFPFTWGDVRIDEPGHWAGRPHAVYVAIVQREEQVLLVFERQGGSVYLADGTRIQNIHYDLSTDLFAALEERFNQPHPAKGGVP